MIKNKVTLLDREFHFGIGFLNEFIDGSGISFEELLMQPLVTFIPKAMFYSMSYALKRQGLENDFSMNDIFDLIDENGGVDGHFWNEFKDACNDSFHKDVPLDKSKKKVTAKK